MIRQVQCDGETGGVMIRQVQCDGETVQCDDKTGAV